MMPNNYMNLQATVCASSAYAGQSVDHNVVIPHHPVTCPGPLSVDEESFWCDHAKVPLDDERTRSAIIHSIVVLMFEIAGDTL